MKNSVPDNSAHAPLPVQLDHILTSAVFSIGRRWLPHPPRQVRIEYHIGTDGSVEYLTIWGSAREYWSLICNYSVNPGWSDGPSFSNGFHSAPWAGCCNPS